MGGVPSAGGRHGAGHDQIFIAIVRGGRLVDAGQRDRRRPLEREPPVQRLVNFDQGQDGEAPAIDFAGAGRAVPWATWYESTTGAGSGKTTSSRAGSTNAATPTNKWIFAGQSRGKGGEGTVPVPSLNIHSKQDAENPSVAGGSAADPTKPGPWVTWQETTNLPINRGPDLRQPAERSRAGELRWVTPEGVVKAGHVPAIGGFCSSRSASRAWAPAAPIPA